MHLPQWSGANPDAIEASVEALDAVREARANAATRNLLVLFDEDAIDEGQLVLAVAPLLSAAEVEEPAPPRAPPTPAGRAAPARATARRAGRRARIAVRGLDHQPELARTVVEALEALPVVAHVSASVLTGRVLVELADEADELDDVLGVIAEVEAPADEDEPIPGHPLDPGPMIEGAARLTGAALGLGLLLLRRAIGQAGAPVGASGPAETAAFISMTEGLPPISGRVEELLGHEHKELLLGALTILSQTSAGSALGLTLGLVRALRLVTEARARRREWRRYEERVNGDQHVHPGALVRLSSGERVPLPATVEEGVGTAAADDAAPVPVRPGERVTAGARLRGGPFELRLESNGSFRPQPPVQPGRPSAEETYVDIAVAASVTVAGMVGLVTRSMPRAFSTLLLMSPRPALIGAQSADLGASARAVRCGVTVVGSRPHRPIRRPDVLVVHPPRALTEGWETGEVAVLSDDDSPGGAMRRAAEVSAAAGSPWGPVFGALGALTAVNGSFDGRAATAEIDGERWSLEPAARERSAGAEAIPEAYSVLALRRETDAEPLALIPLRPRLAAGVDRLRDACARHGVRVELVTEEETPTARDVAERAGVPLVQANVAERARGGRRAGRHVAVLADGAGAAEAFDACDLAIGLSSGRSGPFPARADVLAPGLDAVAELVHTAVRRDRAVRTSVGFSVATNVAAVAWGLRAGPAFGRSSRPVTMGSLAAVSAGWVWLAGGHAPRSVSDRLSDPLPERWGRESPDAVLRHFSSRTEGLTGEEVDARWRPPPERRRANRLTDAMLAQVRSPLVATLAAGAGLSLAMGAAADVALIGAVIAANAIVGALEEGRAGEAVEALDAFGVPYAKVLRDGREVRVPSRELVAGDILAVAPGDRVPADARLLACESLEVDEAALTGESMPVAKSVANGTDQRRILLEGSDVTAGTGRAVVVAVGAGTRMGALAAALEDEDDRRTTLDERLGRVVRVSLPLIVLGGLTVTGLGALRGARLMPQLALGASIAIAAVPEGLPLLGRVAEAGVAQRLAARRALVTRLSSVEALGRVDVACTDKTGTLTVGRLAVTEVSGISGAPGPPDASEHHRRILAVAAVASPHPDAAGAAAHPTDVAVTQAAAEAGTPRRDPAGDVLESPFDPARSLHATLSGGQLHVKGAVEVVAARCVRVRDPDCERALDDRVREEITARADAMAEQGLRVLMVAERAGGSPDDPQELTAVGLLGLSDPLRHGVPEAVRRCREAGVRVLMLTGDHPATARAIAGEAGIGADAPEIVTGAELAALDDADLQARLEDVSVIARVTPLDKVRIVEALQRRGHVVAMTGDGVNDAPALRLADVGVAVGENSTEVARHAADLVVSDGNFSSLAEGLVEGRGFWRNMRRSLGLLLGGNAGEVSLMIGAGLLGMATPLTTRQVLAVNLVTDVLPAIALAAQPPEHRDLAALAREGDIGLAGPLRDEVIRRAIATGAPSLAAYILASRRWGVGPARSVAFASIVSTQLAQALHLGWTEHRLTGPVRMAVVVSYGILASSLGLGPVRALLGLAAPGVGALGLATGATAGAVTLERMLARPAQGASRAA